MKSSNKNLYIFFHISKCAGTTFIKHIKKNFNKHEVIGLDPECLKLKKGILDYADYKKAVEQYFSNLSKEQRQKVKVIYGHTVPYGIHEIFNKSPRYITFIRNPATRIISLYNYWNTFYFNEPPRDRGKRLYRHTLLVNGKVPSFEEWFNKKYDKANYQTAIMTMARFSQKLGYLEKEDKKSIFSMLDKFYFVGITEQYDENVLFLYHKLNINKFFTNQNISQKYFVAKDLVKVKKLVLSKSKLDYELYEYALQKNKEFKKKNKDYYQIVKRMRIKRGLLLPFTQIIFDFLGSTSILSANLREHSKTYSKSIDFIKSKLK